MSQLPPTSYNDTRVKVGTMFFMGIGLVLAFVYGLIAVRSDVAGYWAGVPVVLVGVGLVWRAHRRWIGVTSERGGGGGLMFLGCLFIFGSLWAAVMTANAIG